MYELLGICLALAALLTINALASLVAAAGWRLFERPMRNLSAGTRAEILFAMRVSPPTLALILVGLFLIPSYIGYEPYATAEVVSSKLAALAIVSAAGVGFALWRGFRSWLATHLLLREWLAVAHPVQLSGITISTFRMRHTFPIIAVVGTVRPRLFVAERVLKALSQEELTAAIAHECGHLSTRDNFKRSTLGACRNALMIVPCGRSLDRAWAEAAESAADEYAARQNGDTALNLAAALIEIARMVPPGTRPTLPAGAFILGNETTGVKGRVNRLIALAGASRPQQSSVFISWAGRGGLVIMFGGLIITLTSTHALVSLHVAMERIVQLLT